MRKTILVAAACMIAHLWRRRICAGAQSTEFSSQGVYIDGPGVGVRVGPRDPRRHDRWRHRWLA
jgi:hypothetical protein